MGLSQIRKSWNCGGKVYAAILPYEEASLLIVYSRARYLSAKTDREGSKELQSGATEKALVVCPTLPPRSLNNTGHSTAILPESGSSFERNLTTALMERIPSRWLRLEWHVPCKSYRVVIQGHFGWVRAVAFDPSNEWFWFCTSLVVGLFIERKNQGIGNLLGMVKAGMVDEVLLGYENMEERIRRLKELSLSFDKKIIDSVVKVFSATTRHDPYRPWQNLEMRQSDGSGFAISGKKILTCAHVVVVLNQCTFIHIQRNNSTTKYKARVTKITHECDLAILEVDNDDFWEDMSTLSNSITYNADIPS